MDRLTGRHALGRRAAVGVFLRQHLVQRHAVLLRERRQEDRAERHAEQRTREFHQPVGIGDPRDRAVAEQAADRPAVMPRHAHGPGDGEVALDVDAHRLELPAVAAQFAGASGLGQTIKDVFGDKLGGGVDALELGQFVEKENTVMRK